MHMARVRVNEFYVLNQALSRSPSIAVDDLMACAMLGEFCGERPFLETLKQYEARCEAAARFLRAAHGLDALTPDTPVAQQRAMAESIYADGRWLFYCVDLDLQPLARAMVEGFVRKLLAALPQEAKQANYPNDWLTREGYELCVQLVRLWIHQGLSAEAVANAIVEMFGETPLARCIAFEVRRFFWYEVKAVSIEYLEAYVKALPWYETLPLTNDMLETLNPDLYWLASIGEPFAVEEVAARVEALGSLENLKQAASIYHLGARNGSPQCEAALQRLMAALPNE